jgi:hypothetical protein
VETRPGTDPDRASFTTAMEAARDQLTAARSICPDGPSTCPAPSAGPSWPPCCRAPPPVQRPKGQMRHLPVPEPRRRPPGPAHPTTITAICTPPVDLKPGRTHRDRRSTPAHLSRPPAGS